MKPARPWPTTSATPPSPRSTASSRSRCSRRAELVQECVSKGEQSSGFKEFCGLAPGLALLPDGAGLPALPRVPLRRAVRRRSRCSSTAATRRRSSGRGERRSRTCSTTSTPPSSPASGREDETIGWVYQYFNSERRAQEDARRRARRRATAASWPSATSSSRRATSSQFLADNTLGRTWLEMHGDQTRSRRIAASTSCASRRRAVATARPSKDPRDLRILDPACGSGHFLLYCFDLLLLDLRGGVGGRGADSAAQRLTGRDAARRLPGPRELSGEAHAGADRRAQPLRRGHRPAVPRRSPRSPSGCAPSGPGRTSGVPAAQRPRIQRTHIVRRRADAGRRGARGGVRSRGSNPPLLRDLFRKMVGEMPSGRRVRHLAATGGRNRHRVAPCTGAVWEAATDARLSARHGPRPEAGRVRPLWCRRRPASSWRLRGASSRPCGHLLKRRSDVPACAAGFL